MPAQLGTLKFIKESESKYALYADIAIKDDTTVDYNGQEYLLGTNDLKVKGVVEFDTTVGLTKVAVQASYDMTSTLVGMYGSDAIEAGLTKDLLEATMQTINLAGQAQVNFVYGNDAKAEIPSDLSGYQEFDVSVFFGGSSNSGYGEELGE